LCDKVKNAFKCCVLPNKGAGTEIGRVLREALEQFLIDAFADAISD